MSGSKAGGRKAAATNKQRHGDDFYARIGAKGGRNGHTGGFAADRERAKIAGAKGGKMSKRDDVERWWSKFGEEVETRMESGDTCKEIANDMGLSYQSMMYRIRRCSTYKFGWENENV